MELKVFKDFLKELDYKLENYFQTHSCYIHCHKGCSACCQKGDYPLSETELKILINGYLSLDNEIKITVQNNIKRIQKGEKCPFLINNLCSVYDYRPIVCRTHGLAYLCKDKVVKIPFCVNNGKNYHQVFKNNEFCAEPIKENLDTGSLIEGYDFGEIRNLYDWLKG